MSDTVKVRYVGPFDAVVVPELDPDDVIERGATVEVPAALAERMLGQDVWEPADGKKRTTQTTVVENPGAETEEG